MNNNKDYIHVEWPKKKNKYAIFNDFKLTESGHEIHRLVKVKANTKELFDLVIRELNAKNFTFAESWENAKGQMIHTYCICIDTDEMEIACQENYYVVKVIDTYLK